MLIEIVGFGIFMRLPRRMQILTIPFILPWILNNIDGYRKNTRINDSGLRVHDLSHSCPVTFPTFLPLTEAKSTLFNKPSCTLHFQEDHSEKLDVDFLRTRIKEVIQKDPSLESELAPFLDCSRIALEGRFAWLMSGKTHNTVLLRPTESELTRKNSDDNPVPLIVFSANEFIYIRPRDNSPAAINEYRALKRAYNFPKEVRDQILLNKNLMKLFEDKKIKIVGLTNKYDTSYEIHVKKAGQTFIHSFQKTFLGYWRYVGEAEKGSVRYVSHKIFGRSPI